MRLLGIAAFFLIATVVAAACGGGGASPTSTPTKQAVATPTEAAVGGREITVTLSNFRFESKDITVNVGETVNFKLKTVDGFHTFTVKDLGIDYTLVTAGEEKSFTFTATAAQRGTHKLICTPHEALGMVGTFTVQ